ncbi:MAG: ABC transporter ATP-binding protein [Pedosphaera sp.]|nr:ABC transporter ATP-binding protein [Pedosphaera sp.]
MAHGAKSVDPTFSVKSRKTWEVVRRVAVYLRPYRLLAATTILCAVLSLLASFVFPMLTAYAIDEVIRKGRAEKLTAVMLGLLGAFLLRDLFNAFRILVNNHFEQNVIFDMRRDVYARLQRLPVGYFDQRASGDLMTRVIEDVNSVERVLIDGTEQGVVAFVGVIGVATILFWQNPVLALVAMAPIPILAGGALWYTLTAHKRYRRQREASSAMNALLMDNLQGVRQIKAFGREAHEDARFSERADALRQGTLGIMRVWAIYSPVMGFAGASGFALVLWVGGRMVIQHEMEPGALVGPTGAGKSTVVNLLPAFYEAGAGRVLIDGQDIGHVTLPSLREHISVVSQEAFLFNGTIRENILYGKLDATEAELFSAARAANCHDFISRLPDGYDSRVGERGVKLSVGEKQRVSIARALLKNSPILILDEATASVDTATERLIQEALQRLMSGRTSFVIAHRLSTIREADQILVLRHGEIIERGTHEELLASDGLYAKLARIQNTATIEESFEKLAGEPSVTLA